MKEHELEQKVNEIYDRMFSKYYNQYADPLPSWNYKMVRGMGKGIKLLIREKLEQGYKVKSGYMSTDVRGYNDYFIFWKK